MSKLNKYLIGREWDKFEDYRAGTSKGLKTGFDRIDRKIGGMPNLVVVMGEPKTCKSTFVMDIILEKAKEGHPIIYVEKENGLHRTRQRMLCYITGLPLHVIQQTIISVEHQGKYNKGVSVLKSLPIYYLDIEHTKDSLEDLFLQLEEEHGKQVIIVVDSIQGLVTDYKDRRADIDGWINWFNTLKKQYEHRVTIILVSEKNRQAYGVSGRAGAKESGGVEYKAEIVFDLFPSKEPNKVVVECTYFRDGETGILGVFSKSDPFTYRINWVELEKPPE